MKALLKIFCALCISLSVFQVIALDATRFDDPVLLERYQILTNELRCLVCQNETIAGSSAPLALDLRQQVAKQLKSGQSDEQIRNYMTERYGDFILYRPKKSGAASLLWLAPLVLIMLALIVFLLLVKNNKQTIELPDTAEEGDEL